MAVILDDCVLGYSKEAGTVFGGSGIGKEA